MIVAVPLIAGTVAISAVVALLASKNQSTSLTKELAKAFHGKREVHIAPKELKKIANKAVLKNTKKVVKSAPKKLLKNTSKQPKSWMKKVFGFFSSLGGMILKFGKHAVVYSCHALGLGVPVMMFLLNILPYLLALILTLVATLVCYIIIPSIKKLKKKYRYILLTLLSIVVFGITAYGLAKNYTKYDAEETEALYIKIITPKP